MCFRIHAFKGPGFLGSRFFRFQGFQGQVFSWSGSRFFRVWVQVLEVALIFFIFEHHVKSYGLIPMISVPHLSRNKLEDVTNLSNMIFLPIVVQVYEFHGKSENLNRKKL